MSNFRIHNAVKVLTGKYAGLVGSVTKINQEKKTVKVLFQGSFNNEVIDTEVYFKFEQLEAL